MFNCINLQETANSENVFSIDLASLKFAANIFDALVYFLRNAFHPTPMLHTLDDVSFTWMSRGYRVDVTWISCVVTWISCVVTWISCVVTWISCVVTCISCVVTFYVSYKTASLEPVRTGCPVLYILYTLYMITIIMYIVYNIYSAGHPALEAKNLVPVTCIVSDTPIYP